MKPKQKKQKVPQYWVGFDLGGTKMMATVYNGSFKLLGTAKAKTNVSAGPKAIQARIRETIVAALKEAKVPLKAVTGIGVGCPGTLELDKGMILEAPNLRWRRVPLRDLLTDWFHCRVVLANDVDAGTYGEYRFGAGQGARTLLGVFPGTGIGGGCVYEGRLIRGRTGSAMEIGHIPVRENGRLCGCGRRGCLEALAGRLALSAEVAQAVYRGEAPFLAKNDGGDLKKLKSGLLAKSIQAGDKVVERIVRDAMHLLGRTIGGVVNLLAPDVVVLGGGLVEAIPRLTLEEVQRGLKETTMEAFVRQVRVVEAKLGDDATTLGAAALVAEERA
ncbi:MAG: ROK family protein [Kiritimatiellia bacterium]|jgi:glucokinase|nr:ROK family protein [Kiritimatiellia bacterium]